jgi:hypothetical protein
VVAISHDDASAGWTPAGVVANPGLVLGFAFQIVETMASGVTSPMSNNGFHQFRVVAWSRLGLGAKK